MVFGSDAWDTLFGPPRAKDLHPFREIRGRHHAVSTPGDILFHIRATRMDLCFELATQIMSRLGDTVSTLAEVHGFNYFDDRDLIGFVDGEIIWAPAIEGGFVLTTRDSDFELDVRQDISIGYLSHSNTIVELYL